MQCPRSIDQALIEHPGLKAACSFASNALICLSCMFVSPIGKLLLSNGMPRDVLSHPTSAIQPLLSLRAARSQDRTRQAPGKHQASTSSQQPAASSQQARISASASASTSTSTSTQPLALALVTAPHGQGQHLQGTATDKQKTARRRFVHEWQGVRPQPWRVWPVAWCVWWFVQVWPWPLCWPASLWRSRSVSQ
jgi:hypothetical protein